VEATAPAPVGLGVWIEAARPRTLVAGITPVLVGTATSTTLIWWRFACALVVGVAMQIGVNYANDYFDATKGVDVDRVGPRRAVASGLVSPVAMKRAMAIAFAVACAAGAALAIAVTPWLFAVGAAAVLAALGYSGGPRPYGSAGLGEVFVFLFFGVVATVGSAYVQVERVTSEAIVSAVPIGLLAVAILVVNNLRDIETDRSAGKITLAVRWGPERGKAFYDVVVAGALLFTFVLAAVAHAPWVLLGLLGAPFAIAGRSALAKGRGGAFAALQRSAALQAAYGILASIGLWIS
jgi:1,4-dihydroxy-2-naphthoate octaprenyltransferase